MSDEKQTVELEVPPGWAISMSEKIARGFEDTNARLSGIENTVDTLVEDGKAANQRMTRLELRMDQVDKRASNQSERVRQASDVDLRHDAAIASLVTRSETLEGKVDAQLAILARLDAVAANPMVRRVAYALGAAVLSYLAAKGWLVR